MRAVNLIPQERRRDAGGAAGRSGGAVYLLLGGLAVLVVMAGLYAKARHDRADADSQTALINQRAATASAEASVLSAYTQFAALRVDRSTAIQGVADGRVNWALAIRQVVGALPRDTRLTSMTGTGAGAAPSGAAPSGAAPAAPAGAGPAGPSVELVGCTGTHSKVADVIERLRGITGNPTISLSFSQRQASAKAVTAVSPGAGTGSSCPAPTQFSLTIKYSALPSDSAPAAVPIAAAPAAPGAAR